MRIAFNPSTVEALITPPNNKDITFDLRGRNIFARGVKFCGIDTWRDIKINNVSIGSNILDLRNGSNTILTNTNGVVTINSTWRPVVDNLTSDSTTSSLSAKQGKILKSLIDGKSDSGHNHDDRYLKLTGGTMASNALITFADSGSWGTDKGPQGARGGLYWTGQSDYAKLYAEETREDNLDLVIQFGDDNSNGLSIRNKDNTQTSYISSSGVITTETFKGNLDWSYITNKPATATRWPSWAEVTGKPSSFTPSTHTHGLFNSVFFLNMPSISGNAKWKEVFGYPVTYNLLLSVRINSPAPEWCVGNYGSGILYGGSDTKGFMSSAYNEPLIMWAGGNGSSDDSVPKWYIGIKGIHKSIYNLATIASEANAAYNLRHSHANKLVLDGITSVLVNNWNTAYTFVNTITGTDTDKVINKWDEIVNFLAGITEDNKLNTLLNSKLSVYELANNTNVGTIKNNGIYYSTSDASSDTLTNSPFNTGFTLINMTSLDNGDDLRRSRLAFNAYGEIKVSDDRDLANTAETWYNVLTSKNSGISDSTIKLNGTSITVYSSSTADGRYVKKSGDTMSGVLTIDTTNFGALTIKRNDDANYASIQFRGKSNVYGYIGLNSASKDKLFSRFNSEGSKIYTILDTSSTYVSNGKGVINGTTITLVSNADTTDGVHLEWSGQLTYDLYSWLAGWTNDGKKIKAVNKSLFATSGHAHDDRYVRAFGTSNDNIDSDWGLSFKTFDPIPSGTPPELNPNISILNIGNIFNRRKLLAFIYNNDNIYYRRHVDNGFTNWRRLAFADEIPTSLKNPHALTISLNGTSQGPYDGSAAKDINITPSSIGAATSNHNHDNRYVRKWTGVYGNANKFLKLTISDEKGWIRLEVSDSNDSLTAGYGIYMIGWYWHYNSTDNLTVKCLYANDSRYTTALKIVRTSRNNYDFYFLFTSDSSYPSYTINYSGSVYSIDCTVTAIDTIPTATWTSSLSALQLNASQVDWSGITNKPSAFNPAAHTHTVFNNNVMIKGTNGISDSASIHLGIGDSDTGFKWISDGKCLIYANNVAVGEWTQNGMNWFKNPTVNDNKVWNAGNDGSGSGLDADTVDGYHASKFPYINNNGIWRIYGNAAVAALADNTAGLSSWAFGESRNYGITYLGILKPSTNTCGINANGTIAVFGQDDTHLGIASDCSIANLQVFGGNADKIVWRKKVAFTDSNVASATKLQTARNIFGLPFDGTNDIGSMSFLIDSNIDTDTSAIKWTAKIVSKYTSASTGGQGLLIGAATDRKYCRGGGIAAYATNTWGNTTNLAIYKSQGYDYGVKPIEVITITDNLNVGIGITSPAYKLDVNGQIHSSFDSNNGNPCIMVNPTNDTDWCYGIEVLATKLTAGHRTGAYWAGKTNSTNNAICMSYYHAGDGSEDNRLIWHTWGSGDKMMLTANGRVGIGVIPSYKLHVAGDIYTTTGFKKNGSSDSYVLLGGGGHKLESSLNVANADTTDGVHITWAGELTSTSYLAAWETDGSALRAINPSNVSVGNSDKVDGYHASSLVKFYLSPMANDAPADSAKSWFINTMPSASGAIVYNVSGIEKTIIAGKSSGAFGHMLQLNYYDTYLRILRYRGGSWMSTDWEKISAGYADSAGSVAWDSITGKPSSYIPSAHTHSWTSITDKLVAGNEFNIVNAGFNTEIWFNYLPINDRSKTASIHTYIMGNGAKGMASVTASGFVKNGSSDSYVLLGGGGHKALSDFSMSHSHPYLPLAGGTMLDLSRIGVNGDLFIGDANNGGWLYFQDIASLDGVDYWSISTDGSAEFEDISTRSDVNVGGLIYRGGISSSWNKGRDNALLRDTSANGYHPLWSLKTTNGSWDFGEYNQTEWNNIPVLSYITDTQYNGSSPVTTYQIKFPLASGTVALTSNIPNPTDYYWADVKVSSSPSTTTFPTFLNLATTNKILRRHRNLFFTLPFFAAYGLINLSTLTFEGNVACTVTKITNNHFKISFDILDDIYRYLIFLTPVYASGYVEVEYYNSDGRTLDYDLYPSSTSINTVNVMLINFRDYVK